MVTVLSNLSKNNNLDIMQIIGSDPCIIVTVIIIVHKIHIITLYSHKIPTMDGNTSIAIIYLLK